MMLRKPFAFIILAGMSFAGLFSCKKESSTPVPANPAAGPSSFVITTHPDDPLFGIAKYDNGNQVHFFGLRDSIGTPLKITSFMTIIGKDSTWMHMNDAGKISMIRPQNGCEFTLDWQPDGQVIVAARPNDTTELQTEFTAAQRPGRGSFFPSSPGIGMQSVSRSEGSGQLSTNSDQNACIVNLVKCGVPVLQAYDIRVIAQDGEGKNLGTFPAINMGGGVYKAMVPGGLAPTNVIALSKLCKSLFNLLDVSCSLMEIFILKEYLCLSLSTAAVASGIAAPASGVIFAGCEAVGTALEVYCGTVNASDLPSMICSGEVWDRTINYDMWIFATTPGYSYGISSPKAFVQNGYQSLPDLTISMPDEIKFGKISVAPQRPVYRNYYTIKFPIFCLPPNHSVQVTGSTTKNEYFETSYSASEMGDAKADVELNCARLFRDPICLSVNAMVKNQNGITVKSYYSHFDIN